MNFIPVALGGAIGTMCRYALSLLIVKSDFPLMTFLTNFAGCFFIGFIAGYAKKVGLNKNAVLFIKTGFCGGFTTFSTFSLETWTLIERQNFLTAGFYASASILFCIAGVVLGSLISSR